MPIRAVLLLFAMGALASVPYPALSQAEARKYSNDFLNIGVGAGAAGMGNARTGLVSDVTAGYWNPAGLVHINTNHEVALMHSEQFGGVVKYDYGAFATRLEDDRRLGFSVIRVGVDDIPNTLNIREGNTFNFDKITSFSVADMAFLFSYAQPVAAVKGLSLGGNIKIINRRIGQFATAWGFGLDAGLQYHNAGWRLGLMASDVTNTFNAWTFNTEAFEEVFRQTGNELPQNSVEITRPAVSLGLGRHFFSNSLIEVDAGIDAEINFDGERNVIGNVGNVSFDPRAGIEANYDELVYLRLGAMNVQYLTDESGEENLYAYPTAGLGIAYKFFKLDYALSNLAGFNRQLYSHLVSLRLSFDAIKI